MPYDIQAFLFIKKKQQISAYDIWAFVTNLCFAYSVSDHDKLTSDYSKFS